MKKLYDVYFKANPPRLMRKNLTEEQMDIFWKEIKWWQKASIEVREKAIEKDDDSR